MMSIEAIRKAQRAEGPATILAIGTATPPNAVDQSTYPDYYFRVTNSEHKAELKEKFKRMCKQHYCNTPLFLFVQISTSPLCLMYVVICSLWSYTVRLVGYTVDDESKF